jgi:hypothetical protein
VIGIAGNSSIDLDWKSKGYAVRVNGVEVARDGDTFCPVGNDRIAFYSKKGGRLSAPVPAGWNPQSVAALALYPDRAEEVAISKTAGSFTVDAAPGRPIVIFRDGASARKRMGLER